MLVQAPKATGIFDRIVCGVDSSPESLEAARQADRLRSSEGLLRLATVADVNVAVHAGYAATHVLGELDAAARDALHKAGDAVHPSSTHLLAGDPVPSLLNELSRSDATLLSVGPHGHSRMLDLDSDVVDDQRKPVEALVDLSEEADLLVVGSRGLHGPAALGSVSERVAHRAASSVLVVRPPSD